MKDFQCRECGSERISAVPMNVDDWMTISLLKTLIGGSIINPMFCFKMKCMDCGYIRIEKHSLHDVFDIVTFDDNL